MYFVIAFGHMGATHEDKFGGVVVALRDTKFQLRDVVRLWVPKDQYLWGRVCAIFDLSENFSTFRLSDHSPADEERQRAPANDRYLQNVNLHHEFAGHVHP